MSNTKSHILSKVATLLDKFSDRLVRIANQTRQNTDAVASLTDKVRLEVGAQQERLAALADDIDKKVGKSDVRFLADVVEGIKKENDVRENNQTARDQNNVQSIVNLRDSTQKGFDQVRSDVDQLLKLNQRLNERVGQVESQNLSLASTVSLLQNRLNAPAPAPSIPSDHVWLNKKLTEAQPEKLTTQEGVIAESWESYRHRPGASLPSTPGINRSYYQYSTALNPLGADGVGKYMTRQFNEYCSEAGVQCTVQMDPNDFQQIFIFKNLGDRLVKIEWGTEVRFIEPKEYTIVKARDTSVLDGNWNYIPRVTVLNNGLNGE